MATNLAIEDWLIEEAKSIGKHRTNKVLKGRIPLMVLHSIYYYQYYDYKKQRAAK